ncbi:hypothetical protein ACQ86N_40365 [Puia sp. P3]|uniref:hypothetical protein n=1 Tax=Puia sp. P3 TaxID=3423952 RepID=UPI003D67F7AA
MINAKPSSFVLLIVVIPLIVYFFFVQWQPTTIYGDDLIVYMKHSGLHGFAEKMSLPTTMGKYRPVHGLVLNVLIAAFQKNLAGYFLFNIGIQVLNTFLFAMVVNLFVSSAFYSLFISLTVGLSRFALYNVTQLFYGGPMEGVAMSFF